MNLIGQLFRLRYRQAVKVARIHIPITTGTAKRRDQLARRFVKWIQCKRRFTVNQFMLEFPGLGMPDCLQALHASGLLLLRKGEYHLSAEALFTMQRTGGHPGGRPVGVDARPAPLAGNRS